MNDTQLLFLLFLLLSTRPPVGEVRPNHEAVMFQPQTGTSLDLGSAAIVNLFSILSDPHVTTILWIFRPPPPWPTAYHPPIFHPSTPLHSLYCNHFYPPILLGAERPSTWTLPPTASLHHPSMHFPPFLGVHWSSAPRDYDFCAPRPFAPPLRPLVKSVCSARDLGWGSLRYLG